MSPDELVNDYGCDSLRLYELFVGPPELDSEWVTEELTEYTDSLTVSGSLQWITRIKVSRLLTRL